MGRKRADSGLPFIDIRRNNAVEEVYKLIDQLKVVEVNVDVLYNLMTSYVRIKQENRELKTSGHIYTTNPITMENPVISDDEKWVGIGEYANSRRIERQRVYYAINHGYLIPKDEKGRIKIDKEVADKYFNKRVYTRTNLFKLQDENEALRERIEIQKVEFREEILALRQKIKELENGK